MREEINKLEEEIRKLCMETYGKQGDEMIELIEKAYFYELHVKLHVTNKSNTIDLCKMFIRMIKKDKEKGAINVKVRIPKVKGGEEETMNEKEKVQINCDSMDIKEVATLLLRDDQNAILIADNLNREYPKNGDVYYIDMSGIIRMVCHKGKWILVDGCDMPSKVKGKTIGELWNAIQGVGNVNTRDVRGNC